MRLVMPAALALTLAACTATTSVSTTSSPRDPGSSTSSPEPHTTSSAASTVATAATTTTTYLDPESLTIESFPVPAGSRPHDVAPAADGGIWYTAQNLGELGWLDPGTGETRHIPLGSGSRPHGVIVDEMGTPWVTDGGLDAIVSVDPTTEAVTIHPLPDTSAGANLNTAVFDGTGVLWFTGQNGVIGWFDPASGEMVVIPAPGGPGPYGITQTPAGTIFYASLAGSHVGKIEDDGSVTVIEPPTPDQGARRVWADSTSRVWVSEWNSGNVSRYDSATGDWDTWSLPGDAATYAVYVDERDIVWLSDFGSNALVRFDPGSETFIQYPLPHDSGEVRQLLGRSGEVWGAESDADHLVVIRTGR